MAQDFALADLFLELLSDNASADEYVFFLSDCHSITDGRRDRHEEPKLSVWS
jgi:hypothetical protein